jgi:hypothetical protein
LWSAGESRFRSVRVVMAWVVSRLAAALAAFAAAVGVTLRRLRWGGAGTTAGHPRYIAGVAHLAPARRSAPARGDVEPHAAGAVIR